MALDVATLRSSFALVVERQPQITTRFYSILFERYPQSKALFRSRPIETQAKMLAEALVAVLDHMEDAPWLVSTLKGLGEKHVGYGVTNDMYGWVGECLLAAMAEAAGGDWSPNIANAWTDAYGAIVGLMTAPTATAAN